MDAFLEVGEHVVAGAHGEGHQRHRCGFVRLIGKDAGVADVEVRDIVGLRPLVRD